MKNKFTTIGGILVAGGALVTAIGHLMMGEMSAVQALTDNWMQLVAGIALLMAADGGV